MELKYYLSVLWKWLWLLILASLLSGVVSMIVSQQMEPVYRASVTLLVSPAGGSSSLNYSSLLTSERVAKTYAELLTKRPLLEKVISDLHLNLSAPQLASKINVVQPTDTQLLELQVEDSDPEYAIVVANSVATSFLKQNNQRRSDRSVYVEIVEPASAPAYKLRPRILFNVVVAAFAGMILTLGFIFLLDYLSDTPHHSSNVEQILQIPTLATIPPVQTRVFFKKRLKRKWLLTSLQPASSFAEAYRLLRTKIQFTDINLSAAKLMVTSAVSKEGKTTTVANLGIVLAKAGIKVVLVDADLRRPKLHRIFNLPDQRGLTDLLLTDVTPDDSYLLETAVPNLRLLPSGAQIQTPSEALGSTRMQQLVGQLGKLTNVLLFDSPPILAVSDTTVLASYMDGVLLVIQSDRVSRDEMQKALYSLKSVKANVLGSVLTRNKEGIGYYYERYTTQLDEEDKTNTSHSIDLSTQELVLAPPTNTQNGKGRAGENSE